MLEPHHWPSNSPHFNPIDFGIWELLKKTAYLGRRITDLDSLKEAIVEEWNKIPQEISDKYINAFKPRLQCVIKVEGRWRVERYWLLIIHMDICQYAFVKLQFQWMGPFSPIPVLWTLNRHLKIFLRINFNISKRRFLLDFSNSIIVFAKYFMYKKCKPQNYQHTTIIQLIQNDVKTYIYFKVSCMWKLLFIIYMCLL